MSINWHRRPYRPGDRDFVVYSWIKSFAGSQYGRRMGASSSRQLGCPDRFWDRHELVVGRLIREAHIEVICDPDDEDVIWAWLCADGPTTVHYALAKHGFRKDGLAADMLKTLLGDRLERAQSFSHEQCDLRAAGIRIPPTWQYDEFFLTGKWAA